MQKILDLNQLNSLISPYLQKGVFTNSYLMLPDYEKYLVQGLYYTQTGDGIFLFRHRRTHRQLFYYLKSLNASVSLPRDLPTTMEIVSRAQDEKFSAMLAFWEKNGFANRLPRKRMQKPASRHHDLPAREVNFARPHDAQAVLELIKAGFDPYLGCIPAPEDLKQRIARQEVICVKEADRLKGILEFERKGNYLFLWHLAVASPYRRQGIARRLLAYLSALMYKEERTKIQLWVQTTNLAARKLYEQNGFHYDGWVSAGLLHQPQGRKEY
ncbi:MAG: GNAT family N-acetyltransferase [Firmicutes bacterium]|nr:GNAT family N-acetyltransferase [Bacillota bacterium]